MLAGTKLPVPLLQGCTCTFVCLSLMGAELPLTFIGLVPGKRRRCVSVGPEGPKKVSASLAPFTSSKNQARHHSSDVARKGELRLPEVWPAESAPSPFMARLDLSALMRIQKLGGEHSYNKTVPQKPCLIGGIRECVGPCLAGASSWPWSWARICLFCPVLCGIFQCHGATARLKLGWIHLQALLAELSAG